MFLNCFFLNSFCFGSCIIYFLRWNLMYCMYRILCLLFMAVIQWWCADFGVKWVSWIMARNQGIHGMKWSILGEHHGTSMNFLNPSSEPPHLGCLQSLRRSISVTALPGAGRYWKATGSAGLPVHQIKAWRRDHKRGPRNGKTWSHLFVKWRFYRIGMVLMLNGMLIWTYPKSYVNQGSCFNWIGKIDNDWKSNMKYHEP